MNELQEAYHEAMASLGDEQSSWRTVFTGSAKRLNDIATSLIAKPAKGSKMAGYMERLNPTMRARLVATWKPFRVRGTTAVTGDNVRGGFSVGEGDVQALAESPDALDKMVKEAVIAEMVANPKVWLTPTLTKRTHGRPKK